MRSIMMTLGALVGLLIASSSFAQTALHCSTATDVMRMNGEAGKQLHLHETFDALRQVENILLANGLEPHVGAADTVQLFFVEADRYLLLASVQGCHVAHTFVDRSIVLALQESSDQSHL